MDTAGSTTLVRGVRTFADDVRRAQMRGAAPEEVRTHTPATPAVEPTAPSVAPPATPAPSPAPTAPPRQGVSPVPAQKPKVPITPLAPPPAPESHLSDEGRLFDIRSEAGEAPQEGTIVKDTRKNKWSLSQALGESIKEWVGDQKESLAERAESRNPKPKVAPSDTRTHIIKAARTQSALAPKDDHRAVVEKLRTFARDAERVTGKKYTMTHVQAEEAPHWDHTTDITSPQAAVDAEARKHTATGTRTRPASIKRARKTLRPERTPALTPARSAQPLQPAKEMVGDVAPTAAQSLADTDFTRLSEQEARAAEAVHATSDVAPTAARRSDAPPPVSEATPPAYTDVAPHVARAPEPKAAAHPEETDAARAAREAAVAKLLNVAHAEALSPVDAPAPAPSRDIPFEKPDTAQTEKYRTYRDDAIADVQEHQRSIPQIAAAQETRRVQAAAPKPAPFSPRPFIIAGAAMVAIIVTVGVGFFFIAGDRGTSPEATVGTRTPDFIATNSRMPVLFSTNRARLLDTLASAVAASGSGVTYIYPTYTEGGDAVTTTDFMFVLDPRTPGSFLRNLEEQMMFGAVGDEPFFILRTEQYDTAYAGMLDWEAFMSADLTPLFGPPVRATFDPAARSADQTRAAFFTDEMIANTDARILYDEDGDARIVYAFLDRDTIALTTSPAALRTLIERYR